MLQNINVSVYNETTLLVEDLTIKQRYDNDLSAVVFSDIVYLPMLYKKIRFGSTLASKTFNSFFIERFDSQHSPEEYEMILKGATEEQNVPLSTKYFDHAKTRVGHAKFATFPKYAKHFLHENTVHILILFKNGYRFDKQDCLFNKAIVMSEIKSNASDYYDKGVGLDFSIMIQDKVIKASKYVLGLHSTVFEAMFQNDWKDSRENIININDVEYDVMLLLVKALHNVPVFFGDIKIALKLLIVADKYCIEDITRQSKNYIKTAINAFNVIDVLTVAHELNIQDIKREALIFITSRKYRYTEELAGYNQMPIDIALLVLNETRNKFIDLLDQLNRTGA